MARAGRHKAVVEFIHYAEGCRTTCPVPGVFRVCQEGSRAKMEVLVGLAAKESVYQWFDRNLKGPEVGLAITCEDGECTDDRPRGRL